MTIDRRRVVAGAALLSTALGAPAALAAQRTAPRPRIDISPNHISSLRNRFHGEILARGDAAYERARRVRFFNPRSDTHPAVIARCADADDVARAIAYARNAKLEIAVRSGGNDALGASGCEGGVLIDLSRMSAVTIDPARRLARLGPGLTAGNFNLAAATHRLAPVLGCHPAIGAGGLLLGGGIGWLLGVSGAACDQAQAVELVTAQGTRVRATAEENTDLFWAARGGGGNFGVATAFECRLRPISNVLGGFVAFPTDLGDFLRFYRHFMAEAPDELAVELNVIPYHLLMFDVPMVVAAVCWSGDPARGERILKPLRNYAWPKYDSIGLKPYAHFSDPPRNAAPAPTPYSIWRGGSLESLSDRAISGFAHAVESAPPGWSIGLGHFLHGQITRVPEGATPLLRPKGQMTYFFAASWGDPRKAAASMHWVERSMAELRPASSERTYVNYLSLDSAEAVQAAYGTNYPRLQAIKRKYDPDDIFHRNRNIRSSRA